MADDRIERWAAKLDTRRGLLAATLGLLALRLLFAALAPEPKIESDSESYHLLAQSLSHGDSYRLAPGSGPELDFMPGYPFVLSLIYRLFGPSERAAELAQAAMLSAAAPLVQRAASRHAGGPKAGLLGFAFMALLPALTIYALPLSAEALVVLLSALYVFVLLGRPGAGSSLGRVAACGAIVAALALIKPEFILWSPLPGLLLLLRRASLPRALGAAALACAVSVALIAPWSARSTALAGRFLPFSVTGGRTFWLTAHKPTLYEFQEPDYVAAAARCADESPNPVDRDHCLSHGAVVMIEEHPGDFVAGMAPRALRLFVASHTEPIAGLSISFAEARAGHRYGVLGLKLGLLALHLALYAFGAVGLALSFRRPEALALLAMVAAKILVHMVIYSTARYGLPLAPALAFGAGAWGERLHDAWRARRAVVPLAVASPVET